MRGEGREASCICHVKQCVFCLFFFMIAGRLLAATGLVFFFVCFNYFFCLITTGVDVHRGSRCDEAA